MAEGTAVPGVIVTAEGLEARDAEPDLPGVYAALGALPAGAFVNEEGLARLLGKCRASVKHAVRRGELPRPARLFGKNTWTAGALVRHLEGRLEREARKFGKLGD